MDKDEPAYEASNVVNVGLQAWIIQGANYGEFERDLNLSVCT